MHAITIAGTGLVGCDPGVDLVADLVVGLGGSPIPVACGREDAVRVMPEQWRETAARAVGLARLESTFTPAAETAPELIGRLATEHDGLRVLALGPLTNLADLAAADARSYGRIAEVTAMAGAVDVPAVDGVAEWNAAADPEALSVVLQGPVPVVVVPDDAIPAGTPEALLGSPLASVAARADLPKWWDLAAAVAVVDRDAAIAARGTWVVDPSGRLTRTGPGAVLVATALDPARVDAAYAAAFG